MPARRAEKINCAPCVHSVSISTVTCDVPATPDPLSPSNPRQDQSCGSMPERIAALLHVVRILHAYGRHLADTLNVRAAAPSFASIAACFGTIDLAAILAHLHRGILRAVALERVLLARAARGRDIAFAGSRRTAHRQPAPAAGAADQQAVARTPAPRPVRRAPPDNAGDFHTPTLQQLELQVRRRPIGRTIADICLDLAVVPGFCTGTFWNELFDVMQCYGGSIASVMRERCRREQAFQREQDTSPTPGWNWTNLRRQMVRQMLGFFIGEEPVLPFPSPATIATAVATATGPP